jgi:hypothetical protein
MVGRAAVSLGEAIAQPARMRNRQRDILPPPCPEYGFAEKPAAVLVQNERGRISSECPDHQPKIRGTVWPDY